MINIRGLVFDLHERNGWEALGYKSWEKCVTSEFKEKERYLYYQLAAAKTEKRLIESNCTKVQQIGSIPETHLRPLSGLTPDKQKEVYEKAVDTAPDGEVTANRWKGPFFSPVSFQDHSRRDLSF